MTFKSFEGYLQGTRTFVKVITQDGMEEQVSEAFLSDSLVMRNLYEFAPNAQEITPIPLDHEPLKILKKYWNSQHSTTHDFKELISVACSADKLEMNDTLATVFKKINAALQEGEQLKSFAQDPHFLAELLETVRYALTQKMKKAPFLHYETRKSVAKTLHALFNEDAPCSAQLVGHQYFPVWATVDTQGRVFSFGYDATLREWHVPSADHEILYIDKGNDNAPIAQLMLMPDNQHLLVGYKEGALKFLDLKSKELRDIGFHDHDITALAVSSDGQHLFSACSEGIVKFWDNNGHLKATIKACDESISSLVVKEPYVIIGSNPITVWDMNTAQECARFRNNLDKVVFKIINVPNSDQIVIVSMSGITMQDIANSGSSKEILVPSIVDAVLTKDAKKIMTTHSIMSRHTNKIYIWDLETQALLQTLDVGCSTIIGTIAISHDDRYLLVGCDNDSIAMWDMERFNQFYEEYKEITLEQILFLLIVNEHKQFILSSNPALAAIFESFGPIMKDILSKKQLVIA